MKEGAVANGSKKPQLIEFNIPRTNRVATCKDRTQTCIMYLIQPCGFTYLGRWRNLLIYFTNRKEEWKSLIKHL